MTVPAQPLDNEGVPKSGLDESVSGMEALRSSQEENIPPGFASAEEANLSAARRQKFIVYGVAGGAALLIGASLLALANSTSEGGKPTVEANGVPVIGADGQPLDGNTKQIDVGTSAAPSMDPTLQRSQTENKMIDLQQQLNDAEQRGDVVAQQRIQGELQAARASQSAGIYASSISSRPSSNSGQGAEVAALRQEIANLRNQRANPVPLPVSAPVPSSVAAYQGSTGPSPVVDNSASASAGGGNVIKIGSYSAAGGKNAERAGLTFADTKNYLPPNSIATARVIVGADASTNVRSQSDPIPVVLRITSRARSVVLNDKILNTDISGCLVNGAAYGDLSSEKVFVKLQKMTCAASNGGVAVSEVKGFVAFAGKSGVRGRVVSREGSFVVKAFLAGLVGGIGRLGENVASSQLYSPTITSGSNRPPIDLGAIAAGAGGSGISDAGDKVSKYLIERAEQYQPVVEMPTGIDVEVVFLDGSFVR